MLTVRIVFHFVLLFLAVIHTALAQSPDTYNGMKWYQGAVFNEEGQGASCKINYDFVSDEITIQANGDQKSIGPNDIIAFAIVDSLNQKRKFFSLPHIDPRNGRKKKRFYEYVYNNEQYSLLMTHDIGYYEYAFSDQFSESTHHAYPRQAIIRTIYLNDPKGAITPILYKDVTFDPFHIGESESSIKSNEAPGSQKSDQQISGILELIAPKLAAAKEDEFKLVDKNVFEKTLGLDYRKFSWYVNFHNLNIKELRDLELALEFKT